MNKEEFLKELEKSLAQLNEKDRQDALAYYEEMIADMVEGGKSEEEAVASLGNPSTIAASLLAEKTAPSMDSKDYHSSEEITQVRVFGEDAAVVIHGTSRTGDVHIHYQKNLHDHVSVNKENGVFTFTQRIDHFFMFPCFSIPRQIDIDVPKNYQGSLEVKTSNSHIEASQVYGLESLALKSNNARIIIDHISSRSLNAISGNGRLEIAEAKGSEGVIETSNGKIEAKDCEFAKSFSATTSNGAIRVEALQSDAISLETSNGAISGTIIGDMREYAVKSGTSNGKNSLPSQFSYPDQKKRLSAFTNNASIALNFIAK